MNRKSQVKAFLAGNFPVRKSNLPPQRGLRHTNPLCRPSLGPQRFVLNSALEARPPVHWGQKPTLTGLIGVRSAAMSGRSLATAFAFTWRLRRLLSGVTRRRGGGRQKQRRALCLCAVRPMQAVKRFQYLLGVPLLGPTVEGGSSVGSLVIPPADQYPHSAIGLATTPRYPVPLQSRCRA